MIKGLTSCSARQGRRRRRLERDLSAARGIVFAAISGLLIWGAILMALARVFA
jgi:hypothetical protein